MITEERVQTDGAPMLHVESGRGRTAALWCPSCGEEFSEEFVRCPFDGDPLVTSGAKRYLSLPTPACVKTDSGGRAPARRKERPAAEYRLTTLENKNLLARLAGLAYDAVPGLRRAERPHDGFLHLEPAPSVKARGDDARRQAAARESFSLTVIEQKGLLRRLVAALADAARAPFRAKPTEGRSQSGGGGAGTAPGPAGRPPGELRFALLEGPGLLSRLAQELGSVANDSQLTWPELRRDPAGFTRRAVDALNRLGLVPFTRRYKTNSSAPRRADDLPRGVSRPSAPSTLTGTGSSAEEGADAGMTEGSPLPVRIE